MPISPANERHKAKAGDIGEGPAGMTTSRVSSAMLVWMGRQSSSKKEDALTLCQLGAHDECPHWSRGSSVALFGKDRFRPMAVILCPCACHAGCPVAATPEVSQEEYSSRCTCSGAVDIRAHLASSTATEEVPAQDSHDGETRPSNLARADAINLLVDLARAPNPGVVAGLTLRPS